MAYCQQCGSRMDDSANFCPSCGASVNGTTSQNNTQTNDQWSNTAKAVGTVAGAAVGVSLLSRLFRPRRPPMGPHGPMMGGPHRGPHGPGGFGGPRGGHGGPGGRR